MIRRRAHQQESESSSSDEEDAFTALSRKRPKTAEDAGPSHPIAAAAAPSTTTGDDDKKNHDARKNAHENGGPDSTTTTTTTATSTKTESRKPLAKTSSMKRHHKPSDARKANMDALIEELATEAERSKKRGNPSSSSTTRHSSSSSHYEPDKKGSFVRPDEEHLTTNIFVGGLSPNVTEEDLSNLFQEFGELYSVKIMWPRTAEERNRNRNTGFVCFMHRADAEEAMALSDTDPFNSGRLLMLRWGKNVKKDVRRGTGGLEDGPKKRSQQQPNPERLSPGKDKTQEEATSTDMGEQNEKKSQASESDENINYPTLSDISKSPPYDEAVHGRDAIRIELPRSKNRFLFISNVAKFVSTDGSDLERRLIEFESGNDQFKFLTLGSGDDEEQRKENLLYRWRIWSFSNGDTIWNWKTEPFVMFHPNGRYWIPPPLDEDAARDELILIRQREELQRQEKRSIQTGRQLERVRNNIRRKGRGSNSSTLTEEDIREFQKLITSLSISRKKICEAMVFCFERSLAANAIMELLKASLLDDSQTVTIDKKIARLYLLSDVLYNSQQPGVKNAFQFRTAIESMSPTIFRGLGTYRTSSFVGRITVNKLRKAISAVLGAWTDWGVFNPIFLDDLEGYFEGREPKTEEKAEKPEQKDNAEQSFNPEPSISEVDPETLVSSGAQGDWVDLPIDTEKPTKSPGRKSKGRSNVAKNESHDNPIDSVVSQTQEKSQDEVMDATIDEGDDIDGEDLDEDDLDGEDLDGEELDDDIDGEEIDGEDLDGEELGDETIS